MIKFGSAESSSKDIFIKCTLTTPTKLYSFYIHVVCHCDNAITILSISFNAIYNACKQKLALPDIVQYVVGCNKLSMAFLDPHMRSISITGSRIANAA